MYNKSEVEKLIEQEKKWVHRFDVVVKNISDFDLYGDIERKY